MPRKTYLVGFKDPDLSPSSSGLRALRFMVITSRSFNLTANNVPCYSKSKRLVATLPVKQGADAYGYTRRARIALLLVGIKCDTSKVTNKSNWRGQGLESFSLHPKTGCYVSWFWIYLSLARC